jgi:phage tail sheath protein FI
MITSAPTPPGVYINEVNAFPNSVAAVATAISAFIGYTPKASYEGKSYHMKPVQVTSMNDFNALFAFPPDPATHLEPKQYAPSYYLTKQKKTPASGESYIFNDDIYTIEPDPATIYYLYNSVRMFFQNGGGNAYIISLGPYGAASKSPINPGDELININVKLADIQAALTALKKQSDVTLYVVPEATLLSDSDYSTLMKTMLDQSGTMGTSISILDVKGGHEPNPLLWKEDIVNFRNRTGNNFLEFGTSYYPFLKTTVTSLDSVDYTNINGGDVSVLQDILNPPSAPNSTAQRYSHPSKVKIPFR